MRRKSAQKARCCYWRVIMDIFWVLPSTGVRRYEGYFPRKKQLLSLCRISSWVCIEIDTILDSCECIDCCVRKQLCLHGNFLKKETLDKSQNHNLETILDSYDVPAVARNVFA